MEYLLAVAVWLTTAGIVFILSEVSRRPGNIDSSWEGLAGSLIVTLPILAAATFLAYLFGG